jgi:uncharacterized protein
METKQDSWYREAPAMIVLMILVAAMLMAALAAGGVTMVAAVVYGLDPSEAMQALAKNSDRKVRDFFRVSQGASHLLLFLLASVGTIAALLRSYRIKKPFTERWATNWISYFNLERWPSLAQIGLGILVLLCTLPLVHYTYELNKALPLADWMRTLEDDTEAAVKGLLIMDNAWELIANLIVIAILPGIGEELVFRGIVQPQLEKVTNNPWGAILITAFIFSAIHMQFEGFFPRMLLGVVLGWMYWQTRNLWVPILAHLFNNGAQVLAVWMYKSGLTEVDMEQDISITWYVALISVVGLMGAAWLLKRFSAQKQLE